MDENTFSKKKKQKRKIYWFLLLKDHRQEHGYIAMEKSGAMGANIEPNEVSTLLQHKWNGTTKNLNKNTAVRW